jgi:KUP system potassium uptake protein
MQASAASMSRNGDRSGLRLLTLSALGVVFGDIGTSPLYTMRVAFGQGVLPLEEREVFGVLSLIFWSLVVVVSVKYVTLMMNADNRGEGGILAISSLLQRRASARGRSLRKTPRRIEE